MKLIIARKQHDCDMCINKIEHGEQYYYGTLRIPAYNDNDDPEKQTGIEYLRSRNCYECQQCHERMIEHVPGEQYRYSDFAS